MAEKRPELNLRSSCLSARLRGEGDDYGDLPSEYGLWSSMYPAGETIKYIFPHLSKLAEQLNRPLTALDLGAGAGNDAFALALLGCHVTLVEKHPEAVVFLRKEAAETGLDWNILQIDFITDFPPGTFDCIIIKESLIHAYKDNALLVLRQSIKALNKGGIIFIRVLTKHADSYLESLHLNPRTLEVDVQLGDNRQGDTILAKCYCHECEPDTPSPVCVFRTGELADILARQGLIIRHSQTVPTVGHPNFMFGEDLATLKSFAYNHTWDNPDFSRRFAYETVVAVKPGPRLPC